MKTCILGIAFGMDKSSLCVFVNSARRNGYDGDIVLLGDVVSDDTRRYFVDTGVDFRGGYERPAPFFRGRWPLYISVLREGWDSVLIADSRDVVFQETPVWESGLNVTEESAAIWQEGYNTEWIRKPWGDDVFERIKHYPILCAGTVWGDPDSLMRLCEFIRDHDSMDQGSLNYAARERVLPATIYPNGEKVWTLGLEGYDFVKQDMVGFPPMFVRYKLVLPDYHVPPIVHQYDRHPNLVTMFKELYGYEKH